ncbi:MAG TPA: CarD family transcriptional regulator [Acetobacteraceae bacterium]|nr:CarD family transcriptional regulator [Acetobacteraceae bacterium]
MTAAVKKAARTAHPEPKAPESRAPESKATVALASRTATPARKEAAPAKGKAAAKAPSVTPAQHGAAKSAPAKAAPVKQLPTKSAAASATSAAKPVAAKPAPSAPAKPVPAKPAPVAAKAHEAAHEAEGTQRTVHKASRSVAAVPDAVAEPAPPAPAPSPVVPSPVVPSAAAPSPTAPSAAAVEPAAVEAPAPKQADAAPTAPARTASEPERRAPHGHGGPVVMPRAMAKAEIFVEGDHVVYPTHGVGKVERIAIEEIAGHKLELIHITFEENRMTLRVPVAKARTAGLRKLATRKLFDDALNVLRGRARIKRTMWSRRAQEYEAKINSGDPLAIAEVVRDLHRNAGQPDQSFSERQIYEAAMDRLAAELAALDKTDKMTATTKLTDFLKTV